MICRAEQACAQDTSKKFRRFQYCHHNTIIITALVPGNTMAITITIMRFLMTHLLDNRRRVPIHAHARHLPRSQQGRSNHMPQQTQPALTARLSPRAPTKRPRHLPPGMSGTYLVLQLLHHIRNEELLLILLILRNLHVHTVLPPPPPPRPRIPEPVPTMRSVQSLQSPDLGKETSLSPVDLSLQGPQVGQDLCVWLARAPGLPLPLLHGITRVSSHPKVRLAEDIQAWSEGGTGNHGVENPERDPILTPPTQTRGAKASVGYPSPSLFFTSGGLGSGARYYGFWLGPQCAIGALLRLPSPPLLNCRSSSDGLRGSTEEGEGQGEEEAGEEEGPGLGAGRRPGDHATPGEPQRSYPL
jgi:hypothetical protein